MTEQIKYEAVLGDQELFEDAPELAVLAVSHYGGKEEWCHSALKLINDELTDACDAAVIYDALLSGELKIPEVQ